MQYPEEEFKTKNTIKAFMREKKRAITPDIICKFIYRYLSIEDSTKILEEMVRDDERILKTELENGDFVYYYKYVKRKRYY